MTNDNKLRLRKIYTIVLACSIVAAGLCLVGGCVYLYLTGGSQPFTPETVASAFSKISWIIWLCLGLIFGSFFLPATEKTRPARQKMAAPRPQSKNKVALLRGVFLGLGLVGVLLGTCFDGVQAVVANAIALCMSCIGLG